MAKQGKDQRELIVNLLKDKSTMKQDVYKNTIQTFGMVREICKEVSQDLKTEIDKTDKRVSLNFSDVNAHAFQLKVAGDMLEFYMHTNVFEFEKSHPMHKTGYVKKNPFNSYCGIINIYNFLADSFQFNRVNDLGYLVARIFVNREMRFFIEAKGPIGIKYNSFSEEPLTKENLKEMIYDFIIFVISFDLFTPPFDAVREVTVNEMQEKTSSVSLRTGKRLGYGATDSYEDEVNL
ncbi:MAG TPA: hypothetical protein VN026_01010 [Bacteroidia bacterium]|jgi:hypothetical protein|nr:hypothetical protein [Bacteroidia bacterium]